MEQRVIQIGNSVGVVIPQLLRKETGIKVGDKIVVKKKGANIILSSLKKKTRGVNAKFMKMVDDFVTEHQDVLKELAKR